MNHYILTTLHKDQPDVVLLHIGSNDINNRIKDKKTEELTEDIVSIGKSCIDLGVREVIIRSILPKHNTVLTRLIRQVNGSLRQHCVLNGFGFISMIIFGGHIYGKMGYL